MKLVSPQSLGKLAWLAVSVIAKTLDITQYGSDTEIYRNGGPPVIFALWHGRLFLPLYSHRNRGAYVLVSEHRDGEIIASALESIGYKTVRGSTTRGGVRALVQLVRLVGQGGTVGFTPDGPRGPSRKFQAGAVYLAAKTGSPIIPITGSARHAYCFRSWDSFQLPLPFSRCVLSIGEPYYVTGGLDEKNIEFHRAELERRMTALTLEADCLVGVREGK